MKTYFLSFVFIGLIHPIFSQNEVALGITNKKHLLEIKSKTPKPLEPNTISARVVNFQNLVSNYDITTNAIYTPKERATYTVDFREGKNKITNVYDHEGNVIKNKQKYINIPLPNSILSRVMKMYPQWTLKSAKCLIKSEKDSQAITIYKIKINFGKKSKIIKIVT
ncbi:hypothetical protein [Maribacter ulvicola]|uniref:Beta-lactamase-inhibitor-like, PepSY-like n=1 Tax=Maribacter ulvicola TaxID=228959 RepID=A0A1N6UDW3_9FLAO|nr:hypothetical protein [Maribacter ulvicola]SIQ63789.1 hypothetical protein SAMN05421797_102307 [Maribacter ulvicola]